MFENFAHIQKLKLINYEDEKNFYPQFWNTIAFQKDAVKIEGLKLLGFLTSEYIHNISQVNNFLFEKTLLIFFISKLKLTVSKTSNLSRLSITTASMSFVLVSIALEIF